MKKLILFLLLLTSFSGSYAQTKDELAAIYINKYAKLAIKEMDQYGIPASITIAQGLLESGYGKSRLATEANNHFGIKCKTTWTGGKIYHDDDEAQECFRVYPSVEDSYNDHSVFLKSNRRYAFLFDINPKDYEGWAHGLKKSGYATNPRYAYLLLDIIERYDLAQLDKGYNPMFKESLNKDVVKDKPETRTEIEDNFVLEPKYTFGGMKVYRNNKSDFVLSVVGDTYTSLAERLNMKAEKLARYNDAKVDAPVGKVVYIQRKASKGPKGLNYHVMKEGETMYLISQRYGISHKWLCNLNDKARGETPRVGERIRLR
ncbi:MAG: glucosaminidase domain-containing protein [Rikenellaceae bacterium]